MAPVAGAEIASLRARPKRASIPRKPCRPSEAGCFGYLGLIASLIASTSAIPANKIARHFQNNTGFRSIKGAWSACQGRTFMGFVRSKSNSLKCE